MKFADHQVVEETPQLSEALQKALRAFVPLNVIESGTFRGTGTTTVIVNAFKATGMGFKSFKSIEVNRGFSIEARTVLDGTGVEVIEGLSVSYEAAVAAVTVDPWLADPPEDVARDHVDPWEYLKEVRGGRPDGLGGLCRTRILQDLLPAERPLICLDSCGGTGLLEFNEVCRLQPGPFLLFLDDINHVKHYRSRKTIESSIDWWVHDMNAEAGWLIAEKLCA